AAERAAELLAALPAPHGGWTMQDLPLLVERADRLAESGDTGGAVSVWALARDRIAGASTDSGIRLRLGAALAADGRMEAARALVDTRPPDPQLRRIGLLARGRIELSRSRLSRAREILRPLLSSARSEDRRDAALLLGEGADRLEKNVEALAFYETALPLMSA